MENLGIKEGKIYVFNDDYVPTLLNNMNISGKPIYMKFSSDTSIILTDTGNVYMHHNNNEYYDTGIKNAIQINSSYFSYVALTKDSKIMMWNTYNPIPDDYTIIDDFKNIKKISCGFEHYMILMEDGQVYSWGKNEYGQLGYGYKSTLYSSEKTTKPRSIPCLDHIINIECSNVSSCSGY